MTLAFANSLSQARLGVIAEAIELTLEVDDDSLHLLLQLRPQHPTRQAKLAAKLLPRPARLIDIARLAWRFEDADEGRNGFLVLETDAQLPLDKIAIEAFLE